MLNRVPGVRSSRSISPRDTRFRRSAPWVASFQRCTILCRAGRCCSAMVVGGCCFFGRLLLAACSGFAVVSDVFHLSELFAGGHLSHQSIN